MNLGPEDHPGQDASGKFVIGQGNVNVQTNANAGTLFNNLKTAIENAGTGDLMTTVNAIRGALAPTKENAPLIGVIGGEGHLDDGLLGAVSDNKMILEGIMPGLADKIQNISTVAPGQKDITISDGDIQYTVGSDSTNPVIIGAIGGDLSVNTGLDFSAPLFEMDYKGESATSIHREGNVIMDIQSGNILGGTGASTAITVGNIDVNGQIMVSDSDPETEGDQPLYWVDGGLDGTTSTTIDGNVDVTVANGANVGGFFTGGAAIAVGGNATSKVTGSTSVTANSAVELQTALNGITAGITGGGAAVSTNGGTATSTVGGDSTIEVNNGLSIGLIGGGAAASVDATGVAEAIYGLANQEDTDGIQYGNNDGSVTIEESKLGDVGQLIDNIAIKGATSGGTATANVTGETNINLKGNTTAVGLIGGGMAVASQTYTVRPENTGAGDIPNGYDVNDSYGSSNATASTGKSNIKVNLKGTANVGELGDAVKGVISGIENGSLDRDSLDKLKGQSMALGIFGGGVAVGHGSASSTLSGMDNGALAVANTAGSEISLESGYAAAVFGGGAAVTINNARATAEMTGDVDISTDADMKTVGIFGGGLALSMEGATAGTTGADGKGVIDGSVAQSIVGTVNIVNEGNTDGIFGGGMAIGNSTRSKDASGKLRDNDAVSSVQTSNITVEAGTVDAMQIEAFMTALKNNNGVSGTDQAAYGNSPWWNRLGFNASSAMVDLRGITDETSIAAGGLGMGMTGKAEVTTANVTIAGEDTVIAKDILGGGIAIDNMQKGSGAHVGTSTINLNGGTVEGNVYAGGAVNGTTPTLISQDTNKYYGGSGYNADNTSSTVDTAIVNLSGTTVAGEISGQGYKLTTDYSQKDNYNPYYNGNKVTYTKGSYDGVGKSTLNLIGENTLTALVKEEGKQYTSDYKVHDFDELNAASGSVTALTDLTDLSTNGTAVFGNSDGVITDVDIAADAYLDISNISGKEDTDYKGQTYHVGENLGGLWSQDQLIYDRMQYFATTSSENNAYDITFNQLTEENKAEAAESFGNMINAGPLQPTLTDAVNKDWDTSKGLTEGGKQFFSDWMYNPTMNNAYGRAAMIGEDAAVTGNTVSIARDMADNVMQRLSFTDDYVQDAGWVNNDGGIWAKYIHRKYETDNMGFSFGGIHSSTDYDGAIVGVDFAKHGNFQSGVAFHYGSGDGNGLISRNDYDAWGFTLYGSLKDEEAGTNLMADVGYVTSDNDIDGTVNGKSLSADRDVDAWTIGLRGEKEYVFGQNQLVPYVGLRYMSVNPARYSVYYDGAKAFNADADNQNLWLLPIGVSFRNETVTNGGWRITPKLDLSYIWAFGDTDTDMTLDMGGVGSGLYYDVMDDNSWLASLGVEATKDVWSFGVGYGYQKGDDTKNKTWFVNASYAF